MKGILVALALAILSATIGCTEGPHMEKGGGETAVLEQKDAQYTGRIDVQGRVVNTGGTKADNVVVSFKFYQSGTLYLEGQLLLGSVGVGVSREFSGTFYGQKVKEDAFTWEYRIDWD